jgi:hypothetical protein
MSNSLRPGGVESTGNGIVGGLPFWLRNAYVSVSCSAERDFQSLTIEFSCSRDVGFALMQLRTVLRRIGFRLVKSTDAIPAKIEKPPVSNMRSTREPIEFRKWG